MRAERDKRAAILNAEGVKQSQILDGRRREAERDPAAPRVSGSRRSSPPRARPRRSTTVFQAIHDGDADPKLLAYQYLQVLPQIAQGESNKIWIIPSEFTQALGQLGEALPGGRARRPRRSRASVLGHGLERGSRAAAG